MLLLLFSLLDQVSQPPSTGGEVEVDVGGSRSIERRARLDFKTTLDRIRERKNRFKAKRVIAAAKPEAKKIESQFVEHVVNNSLTETVLESLFSKWTDVVNVEENNVYFEALMHRVLLRLREIEQNEEDELILMLAL